MIFVKNKHRRCSNLCGACLLIHSKHSINFEMITKVFPYSLFSNRKLYRYLRFLNLSDPFFILIPNRSIDKDDRQNNPSQGRRPQAGCRLSRESDAELDYYIRVFVYRLVWNQYQMRSQIFRQIVQKFRRHNAVCQEIYVQDDGKSASR